MSAEPTEGDPRAAFGSYLRAQRRMAQLSLRELAALTDLSNAYLSQLERGLHAPSLRVLRALATSLQIPLAHLLAQLDAAIDPDNSTATATPATPTDQPATPGGDADLDVEAAINADPDLSPDAKQALITVYRTLRG